MKNKVYQILGVIVLMLFSFYYTDKSIDIIRQTDPIMREIKATNKKYRTKSVSAKVKGNTVIPGLNGVDIDYNKSYKKMKKYGTYNESLTVFKETKPKVSINDTYDKYVISGNTEKRSVAVVFKVEKNSNVDQILNILEKENIDATMFIDGLWLENNLDRVMNRKNIEFEILNYDSSYNEIYFKSAINYLNNVIGTPAKYCYADYDNKEVIDLCQKLKLHTIIPTLKTGNFPYKEIKNKLSNASIISLPVNSSTEIELKVVIDYIKSKGYNIEKLDLLLSENNEK